MGKKLKDPGLGNISSQHAKRMINTDGSFNVEHINKSRSFSEAYHYLLNISWWYFFGLTFLVGFLINAVFALLYLFIGIEEIIPPTGNGFIDFLDAFFFSAQTFTTLGYGYMAPHGIASGILSSVEAFSGLLGFAFVTGLLYGRFSKPRASIRFSEHVILREFNDHHALMFRLVNNRRGTMIYPKISVTLTLSKNNENGDYSNEFFALDLERDTINYLPTTWTVVHEIKEDSPLFHFSKEVLIKQHGELLIMISYYDESFNQEVHQMNSYTLNQIKLDHKFSTAYYYNKIGKLIMDHNLFDAIEPL